MCTQFSLQQPVGSPTPKSVDQTIFSPNPESQPLDGNSLKLHQLLTEVLELPEHLSHLLGRHTAQSNESSESSH